jgi:hypothetical protein
MEDQEPARSVIYPRLVGHKEFDLAYIDGEKWRVKDGFTYWLNEREYVDVRTDFVTDFASIPRVLKVRWPSPGGLWDLPAVVHDKVYQDGYVQHIDGSRRIVNREESDQLFRDAMDVQAVSERDEWWLFNGVRVGGLVAWRRYRKADEHVEAQTS